MATHSAVAGGGMSVCDIEEVHRENGVRRSLYGSLLFIAADPPAPTIPSVLIFRPFNVYVTFCITVNHVYFF